MYSSIKHSSRLAQQEAVVLKYSKIKMAQQSKVKIRPHHSFVRFPIPKENEQNEAICFGVREYINPRVVRISAYNGAS